MDQALVTKPAVALMFGVDERTVVRWQKDKTDPLPVAVRGSRGVPHQYDLAALLSWDRRRHMAETGDGQVYDFQKEKARLTHSQAEKAALEVAQIRGELIPAEIVAETWTESIINMRSRILGMPAKVAPQVQAAESLDEVREILTVAAYEALNEIATDDLTDEQIARIESSAGGNEPGETAATA